MTVQEPMRKQWRKNLYENCGYPDNYTDASFLDEVRKNVYVRDVSFAEACAGAGLLTQQICIVVIYASAFVYLYNDWMSPGAMIAHTSAVAAGAYVILFYGDYQFSRTCRTLCCYVATTYLLAPVLKTLTESVSTDTIYSTTVLTMLTHLTFFDYGVPAVIVSGSLSLNAAIFGAVCLASRLPSAIHVTAFIHVTVLCFALAPLFLTKIGMSFTWLIILITITTVLLHSISMVMTCFFGAVIIIINLVCPYYFVKWHSYKDNIYGPWDEAVITPLKHGANIK